MPRKRNFGQAFQGVNQILEMILQDRMYSKRQLASDERQAKMYAENDARTAGLDREKEFRADVSKPDADVGTLAALYGVDMAPFVPGINRAKLRAMGSSLDSGAENLPGGDLTDFVRTETSRRGMDPDVTNIVHPGIAATTQREELTPIIGGLTRRRDAALDALPSVTRTSFNPDTLADQETTTSGRADRASLMGGPQLRQVGASPEQESEMARRLLSADRMNEIPELTGEAQALEDFNKYSFGNTIGASTEQGRGEFSQWLVNQGSPERLAAEARDAGSKQAAQTAASESNQMEFVTTPEGDIVKRVPQPGDVPYDEVAARGGEETNLATLYSSVRSSRAVQSIDELLNDTGWMTTGALGKAQSYIWGTPGYDYASKLETLGSQIAQGELAQMREASKTGGAVGQVSNFEQQMFMNALAPVQQGQSPTAMLKGLKDAKASLMRYRQSLLLKSQGRSDTEIVQTIYGDSGMPTLPGGSTIRARDPQGNLHEATAGTPLPDGWVLEP